MKKGSRFLSAAMALAMCLSLTPTFALADQESAASDDVFYQEVLPAGEDAASSDEELPAEEDIAEIEPEEEFADEEALADEETGNLSEIRIPDGVTRIGEFAFAWCTSLVDIYLPSSVTSIGYCAFDTCESLTTIYYGG